MNDPSTAFLIGICFIVCIFGLISVFFALGGNLSKQDMGIVRCLSTHLCSNKARLVFSLTLINQLKFSDDKKNAD